MVFVLWVPVLWSAWSSFFGGFVCCLGGFPGPFRGCRLCGFALVPLGSVFGLFLRVVLRGRVLAFLVGFLGVLFRVVL